MTVTDWLYAYVDALEAELPHDAIDRAVEKANREIPFHCENCGKTMAEHGRLANCYPGTEAGS